MSVRLKKIEKESYSTVAFAPIIYKNIKGRLLFTQNEYELYLLELHVFDSNGDLMLSEFQPFFTISDAEEYIEEFMNKYDLDSRKTKVDRSKEVDELITKYTKMFNIKGFDYLPKKEEDE